MNAPGELVKVSRKPYDPGHQIFVTYDDEVRFLILRSHSRATRRYRINLDGIVLLNFDQHCALNKVILHIPPRRWSIDSGVIERLLARRRSSSEAGTIALSGEECEIASRTHGRERHRRQVRGVDIRVVADAKYSHVAILLSSGSPIGEALVLSDTVTAFIEDGELLGFLADIRGSGVPCSGP